MTIRLVGVEVFIVDGRTDVSTDGQTDMTRLIVVFLNFAKKVRLVLERLFYLTMDLVQKQGSVQYYTEVFVVK
jgi:hypothetical protein